MLIPSILTELRKYFRSRFGLFLLVLIAFEALWISAALFVALSRDTVAEKTLLYALVPGSQIHSLLAPIMMTILASRIATLEHDAHAYKLLFAHGIDPKNMFFAKMLVLFVCGTLISGIHCLTIAAILTAKNIVFSYGALALYFTGLLLAGIATSAIQLFLALSYDKQQVTLLIGGLGGLLGSTTNFMPRVIAMILPWQYFGLLLPAYPNYQDGSLISLTPAPHYGLLIVFVGAVGIVVSILLAFAFQKKALA